MRVGRGESGKGKGRRWVITFLSSQVERFSEEVHPHVENASEKLGLHDPFWAPLLMEGLATSHFLISAILIVAYWHLKVRPTLTSSADA